MLYCTDVKTVRASQQELEKGVKLAALLSYELACARRAPDQSQRRAQLLSRWPGVAFRIAHIDSGLGILTTLREDFGPKEDRR